MAPSQPSAPCTSGPASPSIDDLIRHSRLPRAEARRLLASLTGQPLTWFMAHGDDPADPATAARFQTLAARRRAGEPLAYLLGQQEFYGRPFAVSPAVLIPRADTETLVETALEHLALLHRQPAGGPAPSAGSAPLFPHGAPQGQDTRFQNQASACLGHAGSPLAHSPFSQAGSTSSTTRPPLALLELGTGSGIIAITLALQVPDLDVHAVERSPEALAIARQNAADLGADRIHWYPGSWWQALGNPRRFDLIVSNPPYIATGDHHLREGDLRFEPAQALTAGTDGLDDLRVIISGAPRYLAPGGWLLLEHGHDQEAAVQTLLRAAGFSDVFTRRDLGGQPRVSGGQWPKDGRN